MPFRVVMTCALLAVPACMPVVTSEWSAENDWVPWLDQPIHQLEVLLDSQEQQQEMNYTISNLCILHDAKLYIVFHRYLDTLDRRGREAAVLEQDEWLMARLDMVTEAGEEYSGGTLRSLVAGRAFIDLTRARTAEVEDWMDLADSDADIPKTEGEP
jgi:uncharacterized protein YecT (DUF1311 family)